LLVRFCLPSVFVYITTSATGESNNCSFYSPSVQPSTKKKIVDLKSLTPGPRISTAVGRAHAPSAASSLTSAQPSCSLRLHLDKGCHEPRSISAPPCRRVSPRTSASSWQQTKVARRRVVAAAPHGHGEIMSVVHPGTSDDERCPGAE
jgi:hypothetical protein